MTESASLLLSLGSSGVAGVPSIQSLLKPRVYERVVRGEVMSYADLSRFSPTQKKYFFYATLLAKAPLALTQRILTTYHYYKEVVPFVDRADFDASKNVLDIEGGIWGFKLHSWVQFETKKEFQKWVRFQIIGGHFKGLSGNIYFEDLKDKGTLVYCAGELIENEDRWPPAFILERGAEVVFHLTAKKMRSLVEEKKKDPPQASGAIHDQNIPQPRSRF